MTGNDLQETDPEPAPATGSTWKKVISEWIKTILLALVLVLTIRTFVVEAYVIKGSSMEPTLHDEERLLISKFPEAWSPIERGDIVIFSHPHQPGKRLIKRVVGLPGEEVEIIGGRVYINGEALAEPYLAESGTSSHEWPSVVPEGHYFVLGDHRDVSNDSRNPAIGFVSAAQVVGKAVFLFYPFKRLKIL